MTNDFQGRHNPASRPADRKRVIYVAQLVATFYFFGAWHEHTTQKR